MAAFSRARELIIECRICSAESFIDLGNAGATPTCWSCKADLAVGKVLRFGAESVFVSPELRLYPERLGYAPSSTPSAEVVKAPGSKHLGLKNLERNVWSLTKPNGDILKIETGGVFALESGLSVNFGRIVAHVL